MQTHINTHHTQYTAHIHLFVCYSSTVSPLFFIFISELLVVLVLIVCLCVLYASTAQCQQPFSCSLSLFFIRSSYICFFLFSLLMHHSLSFFIAFRNPKNQDDIFNDNIIISIFFSVSIPIVYCWRCIEQSTPHSHAYEAYMHVMYVCENLRYI